MTNLLYQPANVKSILHRPKTEDETRRSPIWFRIELSKNVAPSHFGSLVSEPISVTWDGPSRPTNVSQTVPMYDRTNSSLATTFTQNAVFHLLSLFYCVTDYRRSLFNHWHCL